MILCQTLTTSKHNCWNWSTIYEYKINLAKPTYGDKRHNNLVSSPPAALLIYVNVLDVYFQGMGLLRYVIEVL